MSSDKDILQSFALICLLSFDVYMRKRTIETIIDKLIKPAGEQPVKAEKKEKEKKEKK